MTSKMRLKLIIRDDLLQIKMLPNQFSVLAVGVLEVEAAYTVACGKMLNNKLKSN